MNGRRRGKLEEFRGTSTRFNLSMENEHADAGRDGRTRLGKPNSRRDRRQGNVHFPCSADHEQDWQPYPVDPYAATCDGHTYILYAICQSDS